MKLKNARAILGECLEMGKLCGNFRSASAFAIDHFLSRAGKTQQNRQRRIRLKNSTVLNYRRNRGDLQSIREIWLEQHYRLPDWVANRNTLIDLGANIGMTTLWLAHTYGFSDIVVVEPDQSNLKVLKSNLEKNKVNARLVNAAVGPSDGEICFAIDTCSNQGRINEDGVSVPMVSMATLIDEFGDKPIDLIKMDIEGGEEFLVSTNCEWMESINFVVTELHPELIDVDGVIAAFAQRGLTYYPGHAGGESKTGNFMDMFVRESAI